MTWPNVVIGAILLLAFLKGWTRGLVAELAGVIALLAGLWSGFTYRGAWDSAVESWTHLGRGSAHIIGAALAGVAAYIVVMVIASVLGRFARLPVINLGNALGGALVGVVKGAIFVWIALYVALFFPMPPDVRVALHRSALVALITTPNPRVDAAVESALPPFARPYVAPMFDRHRV